MNSVNIIGRLGRDPEAKYTTSGTAVTNFSIAVDDGYGERKKTSWFNVVAWAKTAEFVGQHFHKGSGIEITGRLQSRSFDNKEGVKQHVVEIVAERVGFYGPKQDARQPAESETEEQQIDDSDVPF